MLEIVGLLVYFDADTSNGGDFTVLLLHLLQSYGKYHSMAVNLQRFLRLHGRVDDPVDELFAFPQDFLNVLEVVRITRFFSP